MPKQKLAGARLTICCREIVSDMESWWGMRIKPNCWSCKMAATYGSGSQSPPVIGRPLERVFEEAQHTGEVILSGRKLKDYPKISTKFDLVDTIVAGKTLSALSEVKRIRCAPTFTCFLSKSFEFTFTLRRFSYNHVYSTWQIPSLSCHWVRYSKNWSLTVGAAELQAVEKVPCEEYWLIHQHSRQTGAFVQIRDILTVHFVLYITPFSFCLGFISTSNKYWHSNNFKLTAKKSFTKTECSWKEKKGYFSKHFTNSFE